MHEARRTPAGEALSNLMLDLFRLNNLVLTAGDRLGPLGGNRQNVQRIVNDLEKEGLVVFETNPHHRRAQLVVLTDKGKQAFDAAMRLQVPWINSVSGGIPVRDIETVHRVIVTMRERLESTETDK